MASSQATGSDEEKTLQQDTSSEITMESFGIHEQLGLERQTKRYINGLEIASVGWNICNSWAGTVAALSLVLAQGGPFTLIYGTIVVFAMYACVVLTMAELASVYPTAAGQHHWTAILCPDSYSRPISYTCGLLNIFGWLAITASVAIIIAQIVLGIVIFYDSSYVPEAWHYWLTYQVSLGLIILHNIFTLRESMWTFSIGFFFSLASYLVIIITCVSRAESYQPSEFVWATFINQTGWKQNGIVFFIGLASPNIMYEGIDGVIHLAEECSNATTAVPRALISTLVIGFVTSLSIAITVMYTLSDFNAALNSATDFPVYEIFAQATLSDTAATVFIALILVIAIIAQTGCIQTSSRLTWAFARDGALLGSKKIGHMHRRLEAPIWALFANGFVVFVIGCIYLGSTTAFNAFVETALILQLITFAIPAGLLMIRKRPAFLLPENRAFKLPSLLGWVCNFFTVAFALIALTFYNFPSYLPVEASNMNYSSAVLGVMGIFAILNWYLCAKKHYREPKLKA